MDLEDINQKELDVFSKDKDLIVNKIKELDFEKLTQPTLKELDKQVKTLDNFIQKIRQNRNNLIESTQEYTHWINERIQEIKQKMDDMKIKTGKKNRKNKKNEKIIKVLE